MFSAHPHVFQDEILPQKQPLQGMSVKLQSGKGQNVAGNQPLARTAAKNADSGAQATKPKRRALANITNAHSQFSDKTTGGKADAKGPSAATPVLTARTQSVSKSHLPDLAPSSPERLVGPTGKEMEEAAAAAEDKQIEEKVALMLQALEGALDDGISDVSRDTISDIDVYTDRDFSPVCMDDLGPLPDHSFPPLFMDFVDI